jgi:hypothetical protein
LKERLTGNLSARIYSPVFYQDILLGTIHPKEGNRKTDRGAAYSAPRLPAVPGGLISRPVSVLFPPRTPPLLVFFIIIMNT